MSKQIPLTQGNFAIVDDADYEWLNQYKWHSVFRKTVTYAAHPLPRGLGPRKRWRMHRLILGLKFNDGTTVDHINRNGLDNRRCNLRLCTPSQNGMNSPPEPGYTSKYKGVSWDKISSKWYSQIAVDAKTYNLGRFENETDAAKAYDAKVTELCDEFAYLNFPNDL